MPWGGPVGVLWGSPGDPLGGPWGGPGGLPGVPWGSPGGGGTEVGTMVQGPKQKIHRHIIKTYILTSKCRMGGVGIVVWDVQCGV